MHPASRPLRRPALTLLVAAAACSLAACGAAEDAAKSTASSAASKAASKATDAAKDQGRALLVKQACDLQDGSGPLADGKVDDADRALVASLAAAAEQAGVEATYVKPLTTLGSSDATSYQTRSALTSLKKACQ
ncbi:hypothetical protein [Angustibacter luteus]|uniref:DUF732 domain-containing protein n=1 Tax=Angustibacter luteus TaxID=658456 RepID=A0ABW1JG11_9ACTN